VTFDDFRRRADVARAVPLETVLIFRGAVRDRHDKSKWHTEQGPLSVTGPKFMNWQRGQGGGGAIDLVMHLAAVDYRAAVHWLQQHIAVGHLAVSEAATHASRQEPSLPERPHLLRLPAPDDRLLGRVRRYLTRRRHLSASLLEPLLESGKLYADRRGNAVFLLVAGKANRPVGAELRGTGPRVWRGMAAGTQKDLGYFWIGRASQSSLAHRTDRSRLRPPLRLRCRRSRRRGRRPDDRLALRGPTTAATSLRLERRTHVRLLSVCSRSLVRSPHPLNHRHSHGNRSQHHML
jgi:hypothetical protein